MDSLAANATPHCTSAKMCVCVCVCVRARLCVWMYVFERE